MTNSWSLLYDELYGVDPINGDIVVNMDGGVGGSWEVRSDLTQEEVEELRSKKQELTQYGKEKIRELMNESTENPDEMTHKVRFINIKYTDVFEKDQILTVKEMIPYAWHENFTFEEVEGEYHTIFFEDVK